jgi:hypothetical protein
MLNTCRDFCAIDDDDEFWDEEFGIGGRRRGAGRSGGVRRIQEKASSLQRYKVMQLKMQDRQGNFFMFKKKVKYDFALVAFGFLHNNISLVLSILVFQRMFAFLHVPFRYLGFDASNHCSAVHPKKYLLQGK